MLDFLNELKSETYGCNSHFSCTILTVTLIIADAVIEQANWDTSKVRDKLRRDIDAHISSVRDAKLSELTTFYEVTASSVHCLSIPTFLALPTVLVTVVICDVVSLTNG